MNMQNTMTINDHLAVINYDPEVEMFRGEFVGLNGGADFYAASIGELHEEGARSLHTFLDVCRTRNIEPCR
ncbi:DNA repair protein [Pseudazoarcus pumilus]|uniref:DNA repair protein n=2 Tax=Pseudazoarcus pumilus TaxID=2067960 RepID=A0A2I6S781_9RHOO|nr:DNA repair protein [Pseudazoarcus pumilus]